jgi:hypothetical protein
MIAILARPGRRSLIEGHDVGSRESKYVGPVSSPSTDFHDRRVPPHNLDQVRLWQDVRVPLCELETVCRCDGPSLLALVAAAEGIRVHRTILAALDGPESGRVG